MTRYFALLILLISTTLYAEDKPNVIIIQAADMGLNDMSYHQQEYPQTRALDSFMANGVIFSRAYSVAPDNVPGRFGVLTGLYPQKFGIEANPRNEHAAKEVKFWPEEARHIGYYAQKAGYKSAYFGDWEFGYDPGELPWETGFEEYYGAARRHSSYYLQPAKWNKGNIDKFMTQPANVEVPLKPKTYVPDVIGDQMVKYIETNKDKPFLIYASFTNPAFARFVKAPMKYHQKLDGLTTQRKEHMAHVIGLDVNIAKVMGALNNAGIFDNTIVVFTSTNGNMGDNYDKTKGRPLLRGGKTTLFEGGLRVPLLIQWPNKFPKQMVYEQPVSTLDIVSTVMKAMGAHTNIWDGKDLLPMVLNPNKRENRLLHFRYMGQLATVTSRYKILHSLINTQIQVYDLKEDPYEKINIAQRMNGLVNRAMEDCRKWNMDNEEVQMFEEGEKLAIEQKYAEFDSRR